MKYVCTQKKLGSDYFFALSVLKMVAGPGVGEGTAAEPDGSRTAAEPDSSGTAAGDDAAGDDVKVAGDDSAGDG